MPHIATRRDSCSWTVDCAGWVVMLHAPEQQDFSSKTLEDALAWCLVWMKAPELGISRFWSDRGRSRVIVRVIPAIAPATRSGVRRCRHGELGLAERVRAARASRRPVSD
jgi:hypothetical protein